MVAWAYMIAAVGVGGLVSVQPALNAMLARAIGNPFGAAAISILVALISALVLLVFTGRGTISAATLSNVPWWVYLAGVIGAVFVASGPVIAPVTGALLFFVCIVAGQLLGAVIADHFGAFDLEVRTVSPLRLAGLLLVLAGALAVYRG
ncbi:DMT family transporter [Pelagibacterium halotolerans]|uniref:Integral membrane protein n=1 Tax=Pelagibacterium halotolerans (strain DSM 22347 / JCM 15775 / CGMCC 1.7692 / B2) TaxID=1082931 RepID=G4RAZ4_PELHB|nr:DMT family transporter [Pelagibacterium halotolerans]AEQ53630.1 integral membrane protein [Pelagibacterium halotolerans B2]QJR20196.1 DMT family transporter [Pelagibacterium halotolerans]SEA91272.1 transporter family-2 protein [Pelagibacterium halotolerans]